MINNFMLLKVEQDLVLDTVAYASGDVLSIPAAVNLGAHLPLVGRRGVIEGITVLDKDDTGGLLELVFFDNTVTLGTINNAPTISDADAQKVIAIVPVTGWTDLGLNDVARPSFDPIPFCLDAGVPLYVAAISRDTKTYTAAGIRLKMLIRVENVPAQDF